MGLAIAIGLIVLALGGAGIVFAGGGGTSSRVAALAGRDKVRAAKPVSDAAGNRRKNVQSVLKEIEKKQAERKTAASVRQRLDQAGFIDAPERNFWIGSAISCALVLLISLYFGHGYFSGPSAAAPGPFGLPKSMLGLLIMGSAGFTGFFGLPRWVMGFLRSRRQKKFTEDFAAAIDVIVRSVRSGLPSHDALKVVAAEFRDPVGGEFRRLTEGMRVGLTLEQALKRMYDAMPTPEVGFFGIVMTIQSKSGGNLSEALNNLATVLRDRKRLQGKIKAMSSEAKASAMIIGSLPPVVMGIVYLTTPNYIGLLFTEPFGNLILFGSGLWMGLGILVMRQMINFKH